MQLQKLTRTIITTALLLGISTQSWAHTALTSSSPAEGASLEAAPKTIEMSFTEDVKLLRVVLTQAESEIDIDFKPITAAAANFSVEVPTLSTGTYTVSWTALGGDSHRVNGSFSFGVGAAAEEHAGHGGEHVGHAQHNNSHSSH